MKKISVLVLVFVLMFTFVACSAPTEEKLEGSLTEIMQQVYEGIDTELPSLADTAITKENSSYFLGVEGMDFVEGIASEPMISAIAHSVCLVRVEDGSDIEQIKANIKDNVDGRKWICVGVEEENIIVENIGDVIILAMTENSQVIIDSFKSLGK